MIVSAVKFRRRRYIIPDGMDNSPICTKRQYEHGLQSYAHLFSDGVIRRFGKPIGTKDDLVPDGKETVKITTKSFEGLFRLIGQE